MTESSSSRVPRSWLVIGAVLIVGVLLLQQRGAIVHDTRMDLLLEPGDWLRSAWSFWFSHDEFGRVLDQRAGYLFPMGPFLWIGDVLGVAPWVTERLWMAFLLVLAWWGMARLADELEIGSPATRVLGAAAYALSPFFVGRTGGISAFVQGGALLPWVLLPLVKHRRGGSARVAACWSGVAIALIGGANGSGTIAVLVVPVLWLITRAGGRERRALAAWWAGAAAAAMSWWLVPLLLQSRYAIDFFPVSEQPDATTMYTAPFEVVRGGSDWIGHLRFFDEAHLLPAWIVAHDESLIICTGLLAAAGMAGLALPSIREAKFLRLTFLVGVAIMGMAYGGILGNPLADGATDVLTSGPLQTFRTLYKFAPVVLLPLALGIAHLASLAWTARPSRGRLTSKVVTVVAVATVVVIGANPLLSDDFLGAEANAFERVPSYWVSAGKYLDRTQGRALLVPGMPQARSTWGSTEQEPLSWLTSQPWVSRGQVGFGSYDATRYLDVIEDTISRGGDDQLPAVLDRAGISTVVARADARWETTRTPSPQAVRDALIASGLEPATAFGPVLPQQETGGIGIRAVEIFRVPSSAPESRARFYPRRTAAVVSGDTSSLRALGEWGLTDRALIFASDLGRDEPIPATWIVTDSNQRRSTAFGQSRDNAGAVLGRHDRDPNASTKVDARFYPGDDVAEQTVSVYGDIASVTASSYGSVFRQEPRTAPSNTLDGDLDTSWQPAVEGSPVGEWVEYDFARPERLSTIDVQLRDERPDRASQVALEVTTDHGSRTTTIDRSAEPQQVSVPDGATSKLRITIDEVDGSRAGLGIAEVTFPGLHAERRLATPGAFPRELTRSNRQLPIYVFSRAPSSNLIISPRERESGLRRRFVVPHAGQLGAEVDVLAKPSPEVLRQLGTSPTMSIEASSTAGNLPRYSPRNLIDGNPSSFWVGEFPDRNDDLTESLSLRWSEPRTVDELVLTGVDGHRFPDRVRIEGAGQTRDAEVGPDGRVVFEPIQADALTLRLVSTSERITGTTPIAAYTNPFALAEIDIPAARDLTPGTPNLREALVVGCDDGPSITVGATTRRFSVEGTLQDLVDGRRIRATPCDPTPIPLAAGAVDLDSEANASPFTIESVKLADGATPSAPTSGARDDVSVDQWGDDERSVRIDGRTAGYLMITENANDGWVAELDGDELRGTVLDGWEQGFLVPRGGLRQVQLTFEPNTLYRWGLLGGAVLAILVLLGAALPARRRDEETLSEAIWPRWVAWTLAALLGVAVGGVAVLLVPVIVWASRRWRTLPAVTAGVLVAAAAVAAGAAADDWGGAWGPGGDVATALTVVALMAVASTLITPQSGDRASSEESSATPS